MNALRHKALRRASFALASLQLLIATTGCEAPVTVRGHLPDQEKIAEIRPGEHGRSDVIDLLGSPSALSSFRDRTWYYIGSKEQKLAFFKPDVLERNVYAVSFDEGDKVAQTQFYTLEDGQSIDPVERETPTYGRDLTILQQLLGNLGRFNSNAQPQSPTKTGRVPSP